jgi:DNA-binding SARP family transcriptional activator
MLVRASRSRTHRPGPVDPEAVMVMGIDAGSARITLLRGFQLSQGGQPVALPYSVQRLIAFLALQERPVMRTFVAGNLWLDKSDELACASLRSALWQLRRSGLDLVSVSRNHLQLSRDLDVDVWDMITEARQVIDGADAADGLGVLLAGDLLPDWYEEWVVVERERIRQLRLHALETLGQRLIERCLPAQAIEAGLAAMAADPLRESAHRVVIAAHLAEGNHSEALRQYQTYARLLDEHLGITPSGRMAELIASVWEPCDERSVARPLPRAPAGVGATAWGELVRSGAARR